jgi:hypothetical protein
VLCPFFNRALWLEARPGTAAQAATYNLPNEISELLAATSFCITNFTRFNSPSRILMMKILTVYQET